MSKPIVLSAAVTIATLLAASTTWAADANSQAFIKKAIQGNLAEISVGQLAQQKGGTDGVRQLGQQLVADHTKANQSATDAAKTLGVALPTAPTDEQKSMHDKLAKETGAAFDRDFAAGMVDDHKQDIAEYEKAANDDKDAAGQYATATLPELKKHLSMAQALADNTKAGAADAPATAGTAASGDETPPIAGANSFTEGQAKSRIESAGFTGVSALKKDDQGIWRGTASKSGQSTPVSLDFKGNVTAK